MLPAAILRNLVFAVPIQAFFYVYFNLRNIVFANWIQLAQDSVW
jgi:hypothetical protein